MRQHNIGNTYKWFIFSNLKICFPFSEHKRTNAGSGTLLCHQLTLITWTVWHAKCHSNVWNVSDNLGLENKSLDRRIRFCPLHHRSESDREVTNVRSPLFSTLHPYRCCKTHHGQAGITRWLSQPTSKPDTQSGTFQTDTNEYKNKFQTSDAVATALKKQSTALIKWPKPGSHLENKQRSARCSPIKINWPFNNINIFFLTHTCDCNYSDATGSN